MGVKCNIHNGLTIKDAEKIIEKLYEKNKPDSIIKLEIKKEHNSVLWCVVEIHIEN